MAPQLAVFKITFSLALFLYACFGGVLGHGHMQNDTFSSTRAAQHKLYIVYTRSAGKLENNTATHLRLLHETLGSVKRAHRSLIYSYKHAINGFAALLTEDHVKSLAAKQGIVQIVPSRISTKLFTTNSWNFLGLSEQESIDIATLTDSTIIGVIDTGVNPELLSFRDARVGPIPAGRWRGICDGGPSFPLCNSKLIGVRYYVAGWIAQHGRHPHEVMNAYDRVGHGTHVATTAGGESVANVQVLNGLISGTVRGGNPLARLAVYKIYWEGRSDSGEAFHSYSDADLIKAMEDAISDGVDIINLSLGEQRAIDYLIDPIAITSFFAMRKNILTVCAAGNNGPWPSTVSNAIPWTLTVAATTTNRDIITKIQLQDGQLLAGFSLFLQDMPLLWYELVTGESIKADFASIDDASHCRDRSLDPRKAFARIVLCKQAHGDPNNINTKVNYLRTIEAAGTIIEDDSSVSNPPRILPFFPYCVVSSLVGSIISNYIQSIITPRARILKTEVDFNLRAAPAIAEFSSRGPNNIAYNILKPDIAAPGVDILAGYGVAANDALYPDYGLMSGTSMAAPHVSGVASLLRAFNGFDVPWSPAALKSALMTTASPLNNMNRPIMNDAGTREANAYDYGSGSMKPLSAINKPGPGMIYNADVQEYIKFLCYMGYSEAQISSLFLNPSEKADCRGEDDPARISQINLPSIAIAELRGRASISRTLTNVGITPNAYSSSIVAPAGVRVTVTPTKLLFIPTSPRITYTLQLEADPSSSLPATTPRFGSITWIDGFYHQVRTPIVIHSLAATSASSSAGTVNVGVSFA